MGTAVDVRAFDLVPAGLFEERLPGLDVATRLGLGKLGTEVVDAFVDAGALKAEEALVHGLGGQLAVELDRLTMGKQGDGNGT